MKRRLIIRGVAEADLADAVTWYQGRRDGLGQEFIDAVQDTLDVVAERPESFPVDFDSMRRALVKRFPYAVHFMLHNDAVVVLAVLHERQDKLRHLPGRQ